jgi:general secretion pathway protein G
MRIRGFTLIELLVTLALIGLVASVAVPMVELTVQRGKEAQLRSALREIRRVLDAYKQAADEGKIMMQAGASGYPRSLGVLVDGTKDARSPIHAPLHFLRSIPRDPLADPEVRPQDSWGLRSYKSTYDNPRPGEDVYDVYSQAPGIGLNGIPYKEW